MRSLSLIMGSVIFGTLVFYSVTHAIVIQWTNVGTTTQCGHQTVEGSFELTDCGVDSSHAGDTHTHGSQPVYFYIPDGVTISRVDVVLDKRPETVGPEYIALGVQKCEDSNGTNCVQVFDQETEENNYISPLLGTSSFNLAKQFPNTNGWVTSLGAPYTVYRAYIVIYWEGTQDYSFLFSDPTDSPVMAFYSGGLGFTITSPYSNQNVSNPFAVFGSCPGTSVSLDIQGHANSDSDVYATTSCNNAAWIYYPHNMTAQGYTIHASSSGLFLQKNFFVNPPGVFNPNNPLGDTSLDPLSLPCNTLVNWSCEFGIFENTIDFCLAASNSINSVTCDLQNGLFMAYDTLRNTKPYAYPFQIYDSLRLATSTNGYPKSLFNVNYASSTATTTDPIALSLNMFDTNIEIFNASTTAAVVGQSTWDTMRPYENFVIILGFVGWLIFRFII